MPTSPPSAIRKQLGEAYETMSLSDIGRLRQSAIYIRGLAGERPRVPTQPEALEQRARAVMTKRGFAYVAGGAGAEMTMRANRDAFARRQLVPRILRNVERRELSIQLFGRTLPAPLLLAPVGVLEMAHPDADLAVARAAAALGVPMIFSSQASVAMETCAGAMGQSPRWFQLYWSRMDALMESFVTRAERCGCEAIVLTVDTMTLGWRPRDLDLGSLPFLSGKGIAQYTSDPVFRAAVADALEQPPGTAAAVTPASILALVGAARRYPGGMLRALRTGDARRAVQHFFALFSRPSLEWNDLARLRALTRLPILLKGIVHPDDAARAVDTGMNGVIVSNHGGRQVDDSIAKELERICFKAMAKRASERYTTGKDIADDLRRFLAQAPKQAAGIEQPKGVTTPLSWTLNCLSPIRSA